MSLAMSTFLAIVLPLIAPVKATGPGPNLDAARMSAAGTITTSLTTASEQIRQFAFDGVDSTFFASAEHASGNDHFTLGFDRPVALKEGRYRPEVFQELTGKTTLELDSQWQATLRP
jgi:hypothetical protein